MKKSNSENWNDNSKESIKVDGKTAYEKIVSTPSKKVFGLKADDFEGLLKILGLVSIIVSVLVYLDTKSMETKTLMHEVSVDSATASRYLNDFTERYKNDTTNAGQQHRRDSSANANSQDLLKQAYSDEHDKQRQFIQGIENSRRQSDSQIASTFRELADQEAFDKQKETNLFAVSTLTSASAEMQSIIVKPPTSISYQTSKDKLFSELKPKVSILPNDTLYNSVIAFEAIVNTYELNYSVSRWLDTITKVVNSVADNLDNCAKLTTTDVNRGGAINSITNFNIDYVNKQMRLTTKLYNCCGSLRESILQRINNDQPDKAPKVTNQIDSLLEFYVINRIENPQHHEAATIPLSPQHIMEYLNKMNTSLGDLVILKDLVPRNMPTEHVELIREFLSKTRGKVVEESEIKKNFEEKKNPDHFLQYYDDVINQFNSTPTQLINDIETQKKVHSKVLAENRQRMKTIKTGYDSLIARQIRFYKDPPPPVK